MAHALLSLWVGGVACISFVVAGSVFGQLESRVAGDVMAPMFRTTDLYGLVVACLFVGAMWGASLRVVLAAVMGTAAAVNLLVIAPKIAARTDGFKAYHTASVSLWMVILLCGVVLVFLGRD